MALSVSEVKILLKDIQSKEDPQLQSFVSDSRKGVQQALKQWYKAQEKLEKERLIYNEMLKYEQSLIDQGMTYIAGIDEVGRGPLAGPVVAAAVILPLNFYLPGLNDSKKLSEAKREQFYDVIIEQADVGVGIISSEDIDQLNIYEATKQAMKAAASALKTPPEHLLIDAMKLDVPIGQTSIIKGDAHSVSIAAASVVAKVTRDRLMKEYALIYPHYGFEKNMGYGTKEHLEGLKAFGPSQIHRKSFAPVKEMVETAKQ
ncbi:ribonuclease HII [Bacillus sp. FJAT-42315]|uniref:ribonuclease HII n=1 Tax=Bacillus sp. FJAT-42315 TaxID=2014077 RepID=UPI000C243BC7|nr:ribonuclease HII [Bacillus sp. FJAT-42315]